MFKTRLNSRRALVITAGVVGLSLMLAVLVWADAADLEDYTIGLVSATYDTGTLETTLTYTVCGPLDGSGGTALSHWVLELCKGGGGENGAYEDFTGTQDCTGGTCELKDPDSFTGVTGLKFDVEVGRDECKTFSFKLQRDWTGSLGDGLWGIKGGSYAISPTIGADYVPDCSAGPTAVTLSSFAANSSAGGSVNPLWLGLAGLTLAAGSLFWVKRRD